MKSIFMNKKCKVILLVLGGIMYQCLIYFFTKLLQGPTNILYTEFDNKIPFIPEFIYFYIVWYFLIFLVPLRLYQKNKKTFYKYFSTYLITILVCGFIFVIYPTTIERVKVENLNFSCKLVNLIYYLDTPFINCLPSIHCLLAFLMMFGIYATNSKTLEKVIITFTMIMIVLSTLFVKQHVLYDIGASLALASVTWYIVCKFKIYERAEKCFENLIEK